MQLGELRPQRFTAIENGEEAPIVENRMPPPVLGSAPQLGGKLRADRSADHSPPAEGCVRAEHFGAGARPKVGDSREGQKSAGKELVKHRRRQSVLQAFLDGKA